jgi:hypothetical protein
MPKLPTLEETRTSATALLYVFAHTCDLHFRSGAGAAMLRLDDELPIQDWPAYADFDLSRIDATEALDSVYRYATYGEIDVPDISDDCEYGNLGTLKSLLEICASSWLFDHNWGDVQDACGPNDEGEALHRVVALASARHQLDYERHVTLANIALLADINERSVRNALHATGDAQLVASRNESGELVVERIEALRWLQRRPNFKPTVQVGSHGKEPPPALDINEIMPFLNARLREVWPMNLWPWLSDNPKDANSKEQMRFEEAAHRVGLPVEKVAPLFSQSVEALSPEDCPTLARILRLDTAWLTAQVMRARFPQAMKELQPIAIAPKVTAPSPYDEKAGILMVVLTEAGIRNGYFDIERRYADRFFPADSFGTRSGDHCGKSVELHHDHKGSPYQTDIRVKTESLVSPRKRFSGYFNAHSAKAGDIIRIEKTGERAYTLIYLPQ